MLTRRSTRQLHIQINRQIIQQMDVQDISQTSSQTILLPIRKMLLMMAMSFASFCLLTQILHVFLK